MTQSIPNEDLIIRGQYGGHCKTKYCRNQARWRSTTEVQALGDSAPFRCSVCCNAIGEAADNVRQFQLERRE